MDPSSIPPAPAPTTVPFAAEPNNHPPAPIPEPQLNHPPYAEMIYTAIEALKEKDGSSKRAIAKYIEQVYKETLPPNHSNLLTHHLKRLKNNGMLVMVKKSYKLPRSAPLPAVTAPAAPSSSQSPRPRGRPRKAQALHLQPQPIQNANNNNNSQQQNAEPVWAALGLADDPQAAGTAAAVPEENKRGPGRPRKMEAGPGPSVAASMTPAPRRGRGRPPGSKTKKRVGRPPKEKPVAAVSDGLKRRPGRPPKNQPQPTPIPFAAPAPAAAVAAGLPAPADGGAAVPVVAEAPRSRGRPRKNTNPAIAVAAAAVAAPGRGRGRGRGGGRGRGRGRGGLTAQAKFPTGKPVGRPRKGTTAASTSQNVANEDLTRKLEHFQSKVKESLAVLKPHFNHESPVTAIAAIQELEVLGTMDLNAPLRDETLPQQQPQPQIFQQPQYPQFHLQPVAQQYVYHQQPPPPQQ
ncbi:uncharacterized protein LOC133289683 isoform X2 [Gastrolobium bilobum]|uniref:uncharacterized protein LOC133289683 isoform X2 n=1 Tax=Gastrolobium bilobum TaxID=150636 RepID=UPI002AB18329|nr:uncharacterized protein LOC133289683 isoform X2 [Gastrolobium bilobum]